MREKIKHWFSDGVDFKEFIAVCIISILGYLVYFVCKKMMGIGLVELDIEFLKIIASLLTIVLCFYYGGNSAEKIIQSFYNNKKKNNESGDIYE